MFSGVHAVIYSPAADAVRAFLRDTLGLPNVDAGGGWLIFALPPAELAVEAKGRPAGRTNHRAGMGSPDLHRPP